MLAHRAALADMELSATVGNQEIPIRKAEAVNQPILQGDDYQLSLSGTPTQTASFNDGTYQSMFGQNYDLAYQMKLSDAVTATYHIGAGVTQGSTNMLLTSQDWEYDNVGVSNKLEMDWQPVKIITLGIFAQGGSTVNSSQSGFSTSQQAGANAAWEIWKDGKLGVNGSLGQATPFDQSMLNQNTAGVAFIQKLPWLPLTINASSTYTNQEAKTISPTDGSAWKNSGALSLSIQQQATWTLGLDDQQTQYTIGDVNERTTSYYTQFAFQPDPIWTTTLRVSYDTHDKGPFGAVITDEPAVNLSLGFNMKVTDTFGAGIVLHYRLPEVPQNTAGAVNNTIFTLTATALF